MTPTIIGDCVLYNADCLDVLPTLESGSIDAVLVDPPFGVRADEWDNMDAQAFALLSMQWMAHARRVSNELVTFCTNDSAIGQLAKMIYRRVRTMVWYKPPGSQYAGASERKLWFAHEPILHCHQQDTWSVCKPKLMEVANIIRVAREKAGLSRGAVDMVVRGRKTGLCYRWEEAACIPTPEQTLLIKPLLGLNGELDAALARANEDKKDTLEKAAEKAAEKADVFAYRTVSRGVHPCEKPVGLLSEILETSLCDAKSVLDPFMGSGTTGVACVKTGRKFIGIEKDPAYFAIACERIRKAYAETPLLQEIA